MALSFSSDGSLLTVCYHNLITFWDIQRLVNKLLQRLLDTPCFSAGEHTMGMTTRLSYVPVMT